MFKLITGVRYSICIVVSLNLSETYFQITAQFILWFHMKRDYIWRQKIWNNLFSFLKLKDPMIYYWTVIKIIVYLDRYSHLLIPLKRSNYNICYFLTYLRVNELVYLRNEPNEKYNYFIFWHTHTKAFFYVHNLI